MTEQTSLTGGCLCEAVRYEIRGPVRPVVNCHCTQCRKTSGHFVAATQVSRDALDLLADGELRWYRSSEEARRGFCARCGSSLFWEADAEDTVSVMAGTLDGPTGLDTTVEIYCDDRGDYYRLDPELPHHAASSRPADS